MWVDYAIAFGGILVFWIALLILHWRLGVKVERLRREQRAEATVGSAASSR